MPCPEISSSFIRGRTLPQDELSPAHTPSFLDSHRSMASRERRAMPRKDGFRSMRSSSGSGGGGAGKGPAAARGKEPRRCTGLSDARSRPQVRSAPGARLLSRDWNSNLPPPPPWAGLPGLLLLLEAEAPSGLPSALLRGLGIAAGGPDPGTRPDSKEAPGPCSLFRFRTAILEGRGEKQAGAGAIVTPGGEISCPGVFLPGKQEVYLGVYLLNQYVETHCFPSVFPIMIHQNMRFEKVFENAIDPGAVVDRLEAWEELAYYEENTRGFLFPEPKLTRSHPRMCREVLMKTAIGFPGIAPKIEFSTRTAIRERVFLSRNRFPEETDESQRPSSTSRGPILPLNNMKMKPKENNLNRRPKSIHPRASSPCSPRHFQEPPAYSNLGSSFKIPIGSKPPFVVRHIMLPNFSLENKVDSAKPFGENISDSYLRKSRRKSKFSSFPFPLRRASSLDSLAANVKVIKEPDERIVLRNPSPSPLDSSKFGKLSPSNQGDVSFHRETSFATSRHSRSPSPPDQLLLQERFYPISQSTWKKIHERVCSLLTSHRAQQHLKKDSTAEANYMLDKPRYPLKKYPLHGERYF
ncbi:spermatogenesis associated 6-like protein isoform X3 [Nycticebus coucang]|uniref:spermatogenesis associated 6-like protein isoform X3 n=1 Tax=Nycticebus coucang TaxID=9470 RepID=UPI00234D6DE9|nr:spermatogenesis associated 6-like protein isoform X3 [Nycticebus coucang]